MTTQTQLRSNVEAERLADALQAEFPGYEVSDVAASELRRLVSFNQQLMDEVAPLQKAVADEREACAKFIEHDYVRQFERPWRVDLSAAIRARGNT